MDNINIGQILTKHTDEAIFYTKIGNTSEYDECSYQLKAAIKEIVEAALRKGVKVGLSLSTIIDEPFTSQVFQAVEEGLIEKVLKTQINYGTD